MQIRVKKPEPTQHDISSWNPAVLSALYRIQRFRFPAVHFLNKRALQRRQWCACRYRDHGATPRRLGPLSFLYEPTPSAEGLAAGTMSLVKGIYIEDLDFADLALNLFGLELLLSALYFVYAFQTVLV